MSLSLALNNALTGLNVNQRTMAVISNNIANANTEGYSRQIVDLSPRNYGGLGSGVEIDQISRRTDQYLQTSIYDQTSTLGQSNVIADYYDNMQILLGDPGQSNSIDEYVETFFNAMQQMAETPERSSTRAAVVESAVILSREVSSLAQGLEELRLQADNEITDVVDGLNQQLEELFFINEAISEANSIGGNIVSLLDERDLLLEEIAENVNIRVTIRENETVDLYSGNGLNLLDYGYSEFSYQAVGDLDTLINDNELNPIVLQERDSLGRPLGAAVNAASGGRSSEVESRFQSGKMNGLLTVRDELIPNFLQQLDELSSTLRDSLNAIHNQGSSYPPTAQLVGDALTDATERSNWEGTVRIAALNEDGTPVTSAYPDELSATRPLDLDLTSLYSDTVRGEVDLQTIIDEINQHFGVPQNRMAVGNLNNVQLSLVDNSIPTGANTVEVDFDIENISGQNADFWVESIQILDDTAADISASSNTVPTIALTNPPYTTTNTQNTVTVSTIAPHGLNEGDRVKLSDAGGPVNGIPGADFDNYFTITNVTSNSFEISVASAATGNGPAGPAGQVAAPPYDTVEAGVSKRMQPNGTYTLDLSGNPSSSYFDVNVSMATMDDDGNLTTTTATYRIRNYQTDTQNDRIAARAVTAGAGTLVLPNDLRPMLRAYMVDEDGNEIPNNNGFYGERDGYLAIESVRDGVTFAIDDASTRHLGLPGDTPPREGTNRGFSHHYGLNNFFESNLLTETGDTVKNSAINLAVSQRLRDTPGEISTGNLQSSNQIGGGADPLYTYEMYSGDQTIAQQMAGLGESRQNFDEAGALPPTVLTFSAYAGEMLGYLSSATISADRNVQNDQLLLDGYVERADAISGVNLDEELANTIIYQNAYSASARVISVTDELFETLINSF